MASKMKSVYLLKQDGRTIKEFKSYSAAVEERDRMERVIPALKGRLSIDVDYYYT